MEMDETMNENIESGLDIVTKADGGNANILKGFW